MKPIKTEHNGYLFTTDRSMMQVEVVHKWLSEEAYWCKNIPYEVVKKAIENSYCFGGFYEGKQVGFGRMVTDFATFAYIADVFVTEEHRHKGVATNMMKLALEQDWVKKLRRVLLSTLDAHDLYKSLGFVPMQFPERYMVINLVDAYNAHKAKDEQQITSN